MQNPFYVLISDFTLSDVDMEGDENEQEEYVVTFRGNIVPYSSVTQEMILQMSAEEKEEYIMVGKRWYADNFE